MLNGARGGGCPVRHVSGHGSRVSRKTCHTLTGEVWPYFLANLDSVSKNAVLLFRRHAGRNLIV